jgi:hypothetical protein
MGTSGERNIIEGRRPLLFVDLKPVSHVIVLPHGAFRSYGYLYKGFVIPRIGSDHRNLISTYRLSSLGA